MKYFTKTLVEKERSFRKGSEFMNRGPRAELGERENFDAFIHLEANNRRGRCDTFFSNVLDYPTQIM